MAKLLVQEFLKNHTFKELEDKHGVSASFNKEGYKFSLNYSQLDSKDDDILAQQCRGLILTSNTHKSFIDQAIEVNGRLKYDHICPGETIILAYPMDRFFNYGQGAAAKINFNDPKLQVLQKLDGSCQIIYWDPIKNNFCVATRSVPDADVPLDGGNYTFRQLFEKALKDTAGLTFENFSRKLDPIYTYCFELTSPFCRIVVDYPDTRITLLSVRDLFDNKELEIKNIDIGIPHVNEYQLKNIDDILKWVAEQNPLEHEGVVVLDSDFHRIKVKNPAYLAYNRARDILGRSHRNCLELILLEKDDDVMSILPKEIADRIKEIKLKLSSLIKYYDQMYKIMKCAADKIQLGDKKTFALLLNECKDIWSAPFYKMFEGKAANMKEFINQNKKDGTWGNSFLDKILSLI